MSITASICPTHKVRIHKKARVNENLDGKFIEP